MPRAASLLYTLAAALPESAVTALQARASRSGRVSLLIRALTRSARSGVHRITGGAAAGLLIDLADARPSYVLGTAEPEVQAFLAKHLRAGGVFFDIGANVGYFSLLASRLVGPTGSVRAYEPLPANARALRNSVALNGIENVTVVEAAVDRSSGWATFDEGPTGQDGRLGQGPLRVRTVTLDDDAGTGAPPTVVKMDVEGTELAALEGFRRLLAAHRPVVLIEVHSSAASLDRHPVPELLRDLGYDVSWLEDGVDDEHFWAPHVVAVPR